MSQLVNISPQLSYLPTYSGITMLPGSLLSDITTMAGVHALASLWCCGNRILLSKLASSSGIQQFVYKEQYLQDLDWFPACTAEFKGLKSFELSSSFWGTLSSFNTVFPRFTGQSILFLPENLERLALNFPTSADRLLQAFSLGFDFRRKFPTLKTLEIVSTISFGSALLTESYLEHNSAFSFLLPSTITKLDLALGALYPEAIAANLPTSLEDLTLQDTTHVNTSYFSCLPRLHSLKLPNCSFWSCTSLNDVIGSHANQNGTLLKLPQILFFEAPILSALCLDILPNVIHFVGLSTVSSVEKIQADLPNLQFLELRQSLNAPLVDLYISVPFSDKLTVLKLEHDITGPLSQVSEFLQSLGPHLTSLELPPTMRLGSNDFELLPKSLKTLNAAWELEKMSFPASLTYLISKNQPSCEFTPDLRDIVFLPESLHKYRLAQSYFVHFNFKSFIQPSGYNVDNFVGAWHSSWTNIELAARQDCPELVKACLELSPLSMNPKVNRRLLEWVITYNAVNTLDWMSSNDMIPRLRVTNRSSLATLSSHPLLWNTQAGTGFHEFMDPFLFLAISGVPSTSSVASYLLVTRGFRFSPSAPEKLLEPLIHRSARFGLTKALDFWWTMGLHEDLNSIADVPCGRPSTPLDIAIAHKHWHVMEWLHQHGASLLFDLVEFPPASLGLHLREAYLSQCSSSGATRSQVQILRNLLESHKL